MADLAQVIPLTGRRGFARMLVAAAAVALVAGSGGLAIAGRDTGWAAGLLSLPADDTTPELESAPYPQVIVTAATTDGTNVRATLVPGPEANGPVDVRFARLAPGARYRLSGAFLAPSGADALPPEGRIEPVDLVAGTDGRAISTVLSSARQELVLARAG